MWQLEPTFHSNRLQLVIPMAPGPNPEHSAPGKRKPPPLPPRPSPSSHPPDVPAARPSVRDSDGKISLIYNQPATEQSDVNLPSDNQAPLSISASKTSQENPDRSTENADVASSNQPFTSEPIDESIVNSHKPSQNDSSEQAPPVNYENSTQNESHRPHERVDSTSDFSFCLNSTQDEGRQEPDDRADRYDETLAEIEGFEVSEFLRRSSKYLNEVSFQGFESEATSASVPKLDDFRSPGGVIDWVGYFNAHAAAQLERYCPYALRSNPTRAPVSMSQLKAHASRSYVAILPELWDIISGNQLSNIYRWEYPRRTAFYLFTYYLLWAADLIPSFIVGYGLYRLVNRQLNPPTISQLRQEVSQRYQVGKQAEKIGSEGFLDMKNGMTGSVTKGVLGNSMVFAGVAMGTSIPGTGTSGTGPAPSSSHTLPKKNDYRSLYSFSRNLYSDHGHEIQNLLADLADIGEKIRNLYLWRRPRACWRTSFMLTGILLYTLAISQKWLIKNFLGWLGVEFFFLLGFTDKHPKFRKILNPIWLVLYDIPTDAEFALEVLQESGKKANQSLFHHRNIFKKHHHYPSIFLHKKSRSASSLADRKRENSVDESSNTASTQRKRASIISSDSSVVSAVRSLPESDTWKRWTQKVAHGSSGVVNLAKKIYPSDQHQSDVSDSRNLPDNNIPSISPKTFAFLNGKVPGNLVVHRDWICFEPLKGFRSKASSLKSTLIKPEPVSLTPRSRTVSAISSSSSLASSTKSTPKGKSSGEMLGSDRQSPVEDAIEHGDAVTDLSTDGPSSSDFKIQFKEIIKIKKIKRSIVFGLGFRISDGIEFYLDNSTVLSFDNILNRDQYFNELLLLCSHHSQRKRDHQEQMS
ncbi:hypothetical protein PtA15_3A661 [Puccinia triticina]|uniref:Uncharacterized protein n=1 Tax=Puccinia triticina TaxID=208348 RepID=A0ABY7CKE7_9BASI|nr:uncharacterized protein PtA15_3A661 [Puccinia triticina]WAQ83292.1 hypothetical protein PtA15_3A661 [Puccinia triticina]